jgi:predicted N-acetyltransferase YhbS
MARIAYTIRPMQSSDIARAMQLKDAEGWNQTEKDWQLFLELSPQGCFVAEHDNQIIGTVTTVNYTATIGWIGMLIVSQSHRKQGIGSGLLQHAMLHLQEGRCACIKLDATPAGSVMYKKRGFRADFSVYRLFIDRLPAIALPAQFKSVDEVSTADLALIAQLDSTALGARRELMLKSMQLSSANRLTKITRNSTVSGFCAVRTGERFRHIGPVVAENAYDARLLIMSAITAYADASAVIDVVHDKRELLTWLGSLGFVQQRELLRMNYGNRIAGDQNRLFAIYGPELG